jgi:DNA-binding CsgD family transcriptional regulator/PAS domain-containing protein
MSVDTDLLTAIEKLYAAAADESLWPQVMQDFLRLTDSVGATFCAIDASDKPTFSTFTAVNFERKFVDEYLEGMMAHDPTVKYIVANPRQRLVHDSRFITEREKDRLFYYDWHHGFSDTRHRLAGMASIEENVTSGITVHRTRTQGDYHPSQIERFEFLLPHLERAVSLGFRLGTFGTTQQTSFHLLDAHPRAVIVLDERGRVIFANRAAREIAIAGDGFVLSSDGPSLRRQTDQRRLQRLIGRAMGIANGEAAEPAGVMQAHRPSGKRPFSILVSPLCRARYMLTRARPAVCIVIVDPEKDPALPSDALRTLYGLTPAEMRLAKRMAGGKSLMSAAEELGVSYKTARTQLAAIFRKTSTSRQGELVKLLLSDLPAI